MSDKSGARPDGQRAGQAAFNDLYREDPQLANMIRGTDCDPFYRDERLEAFHAKVRELRARRAGK